VGRIAGASLPDRLIKLSDAAIFLISGAATLIEAIANTAM